MAVKLIMSWDILPGREQEYFEFVVREWVPGIQRLGLEPTDAWFTMYGNHPQIIAGAQIENQQGFDHGAGFYRMADAIRTPAEFCDRFYL